MATFSLTIPEISKEDLKTEKGIKQVMDYLFMLNEQLKYTLSNLSIEENLDKDSSNTFIKIAEEIDLKVAKGDVVAEINLENGVITLNSNRLIVNSDNFKLTQDGTITANNGFFAGSITGSTIRGSSLVTTDGTWITEVNTGFIWSHLNGINIYTNLNPTGISIGSYGTVTDLTASSGRIGGSPIVTQANQDIYITHPQSTVVVTPSTSDIRVKKNIVSMDEKWLNVLDGTKLKEFEYKDNVVFGDYGQRHLGVVAQQLEKVLDENGLNQTAMVYERKDHDDLDGSAYTISKPIKCVDYSQFIPMLIMGYQKQKEEIELLKQEIEGLKKGE